MMLVVVTYLRIRSAASARYCEWATAGLLELSWRR